MKTIILSSALFLALFLSSSASFAQCREVKWPEDPVMKAKAEESKVLYEDALKAGHPKQAEARLNWLLTNVPQFHSSLYIYGAEVFDKLAAQEKDPARRNVYIDSLMIVYDLRIKNCGDEANVLNRKALSFLKYRINDKPDEALTLLDKVFELNGSSVFDATLLPYMQTIRLNALKYKNLTDAQILERYDMLMGVVDAKIKMAQSKAQPADKYKEIKDDIDAVLISFIKVDCEFVKTNLEPKFKQDPNDLALAKKIFSFMLQGKCTDDPLWLQAGESIHKNSPEKDFGLAKNLGLKYYSNNNLTKAEAYLKEALPLAPTAQDKAEVLIYLGQFEAKTDKSAARALFRQALDADPGNKDAYEKIGDLYYGSFDNCAKKVNQADDRLVFLIAADYYLRAGDGKKVAMAKENFPSKEEIFLIDYRAGETKNVGCWINESTTIRTRD
ncbi:MAG: tetratricopeptide repeat protein [Cyclobacteriaceae bacterium]|nr:tetratricopeptide repeat protein [Cyclobacteriaceae bacterium]MDH4296762.1 tetratricopeptide repeat protein [Cyclobacteriaceae bacterium]MDH5248666.1 tetratricopeptide repeat protein [Cyclobacteriaceae bacterium]